MNQKKEDPLKHLEFQKFQSFREFLPFHQMILVLQEYQKNPACRMNLMKELLREEKRHQRILTYQKKEILLKEQLRRKKVFLQ